MDRCLSDTAESKASILFLSGARAPRFVSIITRNSGIVFYRLIFLPSSPLLKRDHLSGLAYCPRSSRTQETRLSVKLQFSCDVLYQIVLACTRQKKKTGTKEMVMPGPNFPARYHFAAACTLVREKVQV